MRKTILATFLALAMSSLHGFYGTSNDCCMPTTCCAPTSCCDTLQGLELDAEFLWWQAKADSLFITVSETTTATPSVGTSRDNFWEFGYDPGFRLGFSYQPCQWDDVALYATYTYFRAADTLRFNLTGIAGTNTTVILPFTPVTFTGVDEGLDYTGQIDFLYSRFDIGFAKYCFKFGCLNVVPKAAFTYLHTRTSLSEDFFVVENDQITVSFTKDSYSGYGATIGFDSNYEFGGSGFSVFSSLGLTGMWGGFHSTFHQVDSDGTTSEIRSTFDVNETPWIGRWMSDIQVGIQYQTCMCSCYQVAARLGWEFLYLPDEVHFFRPNDPNSMMVNGLTAGLAVGF